MTWSAKFAEPIPLPGGGQLRNLNDARDFLNRLRGHETLSLEWQCAIAAVLLVGETDCRTDVARAALIEAIDRNSDPMELYYEHHKASTR